MPDSIRVLRLGRGPVGIADRLDASFQVTAAETAGDFEAALAAGEGIKAIAMFGHWRIDSSVLDRLPDLKVISNFGVGYDTIDAEEAARRGVLVSHTSDVLNDEVADTAIMLWLAVSKELIPSEAWARSGRWEREGNYPLTRSIRNRKVGILGLGRIGLAIAKLAGVFGAEVVYHARSDKDVAYGYYADLVAMARDVEVLFVITPGGAGTRHLVNRDVLEALGPKGILINVARGSVVDEAALIEALATSRLGGAGLDVFEKEPAIPAELKALANAVLLPHVGSATVETRQAMGDLVCDNLDSWGRDGRVLTPVPECRALNG